MKRVAFLSFDWDYEIVSEYYLGLQDRLRAYDDIQVIIFSAYGHYYQRLRPDLSTFEIFGLCRFEDYDGFLVQGNRTWPPELRQEIVDKAVALGKPVVSINYDLEGAHTVGTDNYQEVYNLVTRILSDRDCRHPAFVNGLKTSGEAQARSDGYRDACADMGIDDARFYQANWQMETGMVTAKKMLRKRNDLPDVVFCCNDDLAVGVMETLQEAGVRVPEDVMITGFDNREINERVSPHLTTIDRDYRTIAATALDTIVRLMNGEELSRQIFSPARHILAESCGYSTMDDSERLNALYGNYSSLKAFYEELGRFQFAVTGSESLYATMESCEIFARDLDCDDALLTLNSNYYDLAATGDPRIYGQTSLLMARKNRTKGSYFDDRHVYESFPSSDIIPVDIGFDFPIYVVCPVRYGEMCVGTLVTAGVPSIMCYGFLTFFLGMLSVAIENDRKLRMLQAAGAWS